MAAFYAIEPAYLSTNADKFFFCNGNGKVEKTVDGYAPLWDPNLYFTINKAVGRFSFSAVKVIDAIWDLVIGRGGQTVAAMIAYPVLRRSITLTMERHALMMPTVTSLYCEKIQILPVVRLAWNAMWKWPLDRPSRKQPVHMRRVRIATQICICIYVILFPTLASVMTGYRAQFTAYFGYNAQNPGQLVPVSELAVPRLAVFDATRIDLPHALVVATDEVAYPPGSQEDPYYEAIFSAKDYITGSRNFEEPYGTIIDYYFTCLAVRLWKYEDDPWGKSPDTSYSFRCAFHECSCTIPAGTHCPESSTEAAEKCEPPEMLALVESTIVLDGTLWELSPPLDIDMRIDEQRINPRYYPSDSKNVSRYWNEYPSLRISRDMLTPTSDVRAYTNNGTGYNETGIRDTGRCIAEDEYSWKFSFLLLFTFCILTICFALSLIMLQTDVYWNSRCDRDHQYYSIYTDALYLAGKLESRFGSMTGGEAPPPETLEKLVEGSKEGLKLEVTSLPLSRWEEKQQSRRKRSTNLPARRGISGLFSWLYCSSSAQGNDELERLETAEHASELEERSTPRTKADNHESSYDDDPEAVLIAYALL